MTASKLAQSYRGPDNCNNELAASGRHRTSNRLRQSLFSVVPASLLLAGLAGCGSSSSGNGPNPTPRCVRDSDCSGQLVCIQGFCVQQCVESKDCANGERCIPATGGNSCEPPEKSACTYTSECTIPLICGIDQQCRAQCQTDVDCPRGQVCTSVSKLCADPSIDKNYDPATNDFSTVGGGDGGPSPTPHLDAGVALDGSLGQPDVYLGTADVPLPADAPITRDVGGIDGSMVGLDSAAGPDLALSLDGPPVLVDGIVVTPSPSVRQGDINVTVTITRAAGGLAGAGAFDMGDLTVRAQASGSDTSLVLKVSVPHGAALGKRTLRFATNAGVVTAADVVDVTAITAGPSGVDTNAGSAASPFLTLKQAILVADVGDTIHLMDGTYNTKGGETWSYVIPSRLTIEGDSTAGTVLDGVGATNNPNGFNPAEALTLKTLTVQHFNYGIDIKNPNSTITLQDVQLGNNANTAIYVEQAATGSTVNVLGKNGLIDQPGESAISVYNAPNVAINVTDATLQGGSYVIYMAYNCSASTLNVTGATIKQLGTYNAVYLGISSNAAGTVATLNKATIVGNVTDTDAKGSMTIVDSTITQKSGNGIDFSGATLTVSNTPITMTAANAGVRLSGTQAAMILTGVTISGGGYGIQQSGTGSSAKLRGTTIEGTSYDAYILQAGDLDLGTATESGDNVIAAPTGTSSWCLNITRPQGTSAGNPVTCSGTTLNGLAPTPGTIDASAGSVSLQPQRYYLATGNKLIFY